MILKTIAIAGITLGMLSCTKVTQQDALQGTLSPKGALGMLGFTKDKDKNFIILIQQNNLYDNVEAILTKTDNEGKFINDIPIVGRDDQSNGKSPKTKGTPGAAGSGRLAYNPDKNEIALFTCYQAVHQYYLYNIKSNDNANFGTDVKSYGAQYYSHNFDQRTVYHKPTKMFYQLSHGDAYPRNLGFYTTSTDPKSTLFNSVLVSTPTNTASVPGNTTESRLGDLDVFDDGTVATTFMTRFYDHDFMGNLIGKKPCYNPPSGITTEESLLVWNRLLKENPSYPRNVFLEIIPYKSKSLIIGTGIGISPTAINVSEYAMGSNKIAAIAKTAVINDDKILVAWLEYTNANLVGTWFAVYDKNGNKIKSEFIASTDNPLIFHTVSIIRDTKNPAIVKWITPNKTELLYHQFDVTAFVNGNFQSAHIQKPIRLVDNAETFVAKSPNAQMSPIGDYGMNPQIDYVMNDDGSIDIVWMNTKAVTKLYGKNFYPLLVTSIDNNGEFKKVITLQVRAAK